LVAMRAEHRCEYCHAPEVIFNLEFEVEHIVPTSLGGSDDAANLALACHACNLLKSDRITATDPETDIESRLFHPRQDDWTSHFAIDLATGQINGVTPVGRATAEQLKMNRPLQIEARRHWMRVGLFP
ncbi:MAG: HNH endonuclease, partial [Planctomycetes bacterium]|nr:HNH endonuclease [Planctomycetota bacterium]